jgi:hypothetical protein
MADHRFAADQRHVQRAMVAHEVDDAFDQGIAAKVVEFAQSDAAS